MSPEPYDIYLIVTEKEVFTALDTDIDNSKPSSMYYIDSRFTMYDLVKITSRKNSASVITFYFRISKSNDYIFAHKRKDYIEIWLVVKFENPEIAHQWIQKVSHQYKAFKHKESSKNTT